MFVNTLYAVGYGAWVRYLYDIRWTPVSSPGRFMRWSAQGIALCSYSIYLTHTTFDPAIRNHVLGSVHRGLAKSLVVLSCTFVLGVVFYFLVERPTIISRDRFLKRSPKPAVDSRQPIALPQEGV
jgi:peptidoglycan/LPS O-acetylase OafA/YrhL